MRTKFLKTKKEIEYWLNKHGISNYTLISDKTYGFVVDVNGDIDLMYQKGKPKIKEIPIKFNRVLGDVNCWHNSLTNLDWAPVEVARSFWVPNNEITSLKGCPQKIGKGVNFNNNKLTSLEGGPSVIGGDYYCEDNLLTSLEHSPRRTNSFMVRNNALKTLVGGPKVVEGLYNCSNNQLTSLKGSPNILKNGAFNCSYNQLKDLKYGPSWVKSYYDCSDNELTSLLYFPNFVGSKFDCYHNPGLGNAPKIETFNEIKEMANIVKEKNKITQMLSKGANSEQLESKTINVLSNHGTKQNHKI